nr:NADH dehydrogenase subunit 3 [Pyemotes zhonghuajia]
MNFIMPFLLIFLIILILLSINFINSNSKNKMSSISNIECGFNNMTYSKTPFSNQFFMMLMIFLIFDMELIILFPTPMTEKSNKFIILMSIISIFLILSILMEWMSGLLEWSK